MADESEAVISIGVTLEVSNGPDTGAAYTEVGEVIDVTPPEDSVELVDVTHQKSPGRRKEFKSGFTEGGEGSFTLNWIPGQATDVFCRNWRLSGENRYVRITYPNGAVETWPASFRSFQRTAALGQKLGGTLTVKMAGEPTYEDVED